MTREKELEKVKSLIKQFIKDGNCGLFNTMNIVGDPMTTLFDGKYFELDICFHYSYFELFGATDKEFEEIENYYDSLGGI